MMKRLSYLGQKTYDYFVSGIVAFSATILIYICNFQRNFFSKTYAAYSLVAFLFFFALSYYSIRILKSQKAHEIKNQDFVVSIIASLGIGLMLLLNFSPVSFYPLVPDGHVEVHFNAQKTDNLKNPITFLYLRNALGYIPHSELELNGTWQSNLNHLQLVSDSDAGLIWKGKTDGFLEIGFVPTLQPFEVQITINGDEYLFNLQGNPQDELIAFNVEKELPVLSKIPFVLSFLIIIPFSLMIGMNFLARIRYHARDQSTGHFLMNPFGLPILITSMITLMTFWPGMMTNDSITQWREIVNRSYTDLNPLFHTLLLAGLLHIWRSPAVVAIFQILVYFFVITYGMGILSKWGIPKFIIWIVAFIIALWPFNPLMTTILWKDVLYSISLLGLFIIVMEVALTEENWDEKPGRWITLGFTGFLVASFRHNGLVVAFLTLGCLPIFLKRFRKHLMMASALALLMWMGFNGLIKPMFINEEEKINAINLTLLHHIAAHLDAGTPMTEEQVKYLKGILPLEEWDYDCCYMGNIYLNPAFDKSGYMQQTNINQDIAFSLLFQNPLVDIKDQLCASEMTWRFLNNQCTYKSLHPFQSSSPVIEGWIEGNELGLAEASLLPGMIPFYTRILERIQVFSGSLIPIFRPAYYFYLAIFSVVVVYLRLQKLQVLIPLVPVFTQTGTLALVNFAPAFRYQYGICLIGLFCLGVMWLQKGEKET